MDTGELGIALALSNLLDGMPPTTPVMVELPDGTLVEAKHARSKADGSAFILSANEPDFSAMEAEVEAEVEKAIDAGYMLHIAEMRARRN